MTTFYDSALTTLAFLWRLERGDGITLGFTSHDQDVQCGGLVYKAAPGMVPSAIERNDQLSAANISLAGALTSDAITEQDLRLGRWDGALLWLSMCDWTDASTPPLPIVRGELGTVDVSDNGFKVELRGATVVFEAPVVEQTTPDCRAILGDKRCRVSMAGRIHRARVVSISGETVIIDSAAADGLYNFGSLRWLEGESAGLKARIVSSVGAMLTLQEPPTTLITSGTAIELTEGCDKRFATCATRFNNALNFRGEPFLPGNDLLARYGW